MGQQAARPAGAVKEVGSRAEVRRRWETSGNGKDKPSYSCGLSGGTSWNEYPHPRCSVTCSLASLSRISCKP